MRKILLTILFLFALTSTAHSQARPSYEPERVEPKVTLNIGPPPSGFLRDFSHAAQWMSIGADSFTTAYAIRKDGKVEGNPIFGRNASPLLVGGTMTGLSVAVDIVGRRVEKEHPKRVAWMRISIAVAHFLAAGYNLR
jgi:hypothetical protein